MKPYPQYSGITYYSGDLANSTYESLQLTFERRFANGFTAQAGYTWSKEIDNIPGTASHLGAVGGNRNPYAGGLDKGFGAIDHPSILHSTFVYNMPFGKGHSLASGNAVARTLAGGWRISGLVAFTSGAPLGITGSGCSTPGISATCIVSYAPGFNGPVLINGGYGSGNALAPGALAYINKAAFVDPAPYTFGNLPRSAPFGLFAPHTVDVDMSLKREIAMRERLRLAIQADVFNITNTVCFAAPGTNIDSSNFGQVTTTNNLPRKIQLNARFTF